MGLLPPQLSSKSGLTYEPTEQQQSQQITGLKSAQHYYQQQAQHVKQKSSELLPVKRVGSSMGGSDTGNSTHESECSDENHSGSSPIISPRSAQIHKQTSHHHQSYYHPHQQPSSINNHHHHQQVNQTNSNTDLFDSLAAELRAKLKGDGPPLLLPPRDYDTVHRSKGNLTAIELRRCRNALIVGNVGPTTPATTTAPALNKANHQNNSNANTNVNGATPTDLGGGSSGNNGGKLISSRGSSGIGSDLAPSPERHETNSSSGRFIYYKYLHILLTYHFLLFIIQMMNIGPMKQIIQWWL